MMQRELPNRKHPRLNNFDYATSGAYFVTICTSNKKCLFSRTVGRGLAPAALDLTPYGEIAKEELLSLEQRYPHLSIDHYVIMPNHIHVIFVLQDTANNAKRLPTIMDIVCAYKSLTTRRCKALKPIEKLFQDSFFEHIIRDREDYEKHLNYISLNPDKWHNDELYTEITVND